MSLPWGRWQWWQGTSILPQSILTWPPGKSLPGSGESCLGIIGAQNKGCMQMGGHGSGGGSAGQGLHEWRTPRSTRKIRRKKNKTKQKNTEGVSNLHCTYAGNSLLVIKEMGPCCACTPDMPREHRRLRNQGMTGIIRNTQPRKSCYCTQPTRAARPCRAGHAGNLPELVEGPEVKPDREGDTNDEEKQLHLLPHPQHSDNLRAELS